MTNRRAVTIEDQTISAQCSLADTTPVVVFVEGGPAFQRGNVTFVSQEGPALSFYHIPDPYGVVNKANALRESIPTYSKA